MKQNLDEMRTRQPRKNTTPKKTNCFWVKQMLFPSSSWPSYFTSRVIFLWQSNT